MSRLARPCGLPPRSASPTSARSAAAYSAPRAAAPCSPRRATACGPAASWSPRARIEKKGARALFTNRRAYLQGRGRDAPMRRPTGASNEPARRRRRRARGTAQATTMRPSRDDRATEHSARLCPQFHEACPDAAHGPTPNFWGLGRPATSAKKSLAQIRRIFSAVRNTLTTYDYYDRLTNKFKLIK